MTGSSNIAILTLALVLALVPFSSAKFLHFGTQGTYKTAKQSDQGSCCVDLPRLPSLFSRVTSDDSLPQGNLNWSGYRDLDVLPETQSLITELSDTMNFCNPIGGAFLHYQCGLSENLTYRNCTTSWVDKCPEGVIGFPTSAYALAMGINGAMAVETLLNTVALFLSHKRVPEAVMALRVRQVLRSDHNSLSSLRYAAPASDDESLANYVARNFKTISLIGKVFTTLSPMVVLAGLNFYSIYAREQSRRATISDILTTFEHSSQCEGLSANSLGNQIVFTGGLKDLQDDPVRLGFVRLTNGVLVLRVTLRQERFRGYVSYSCEDGSALSGYSDPVYFSQLDYIDLPTMVNVVCDVLINYYNISSPTVIAPSCRDISCDLGFQMYKATFRYWGNSNGMSNCISTAIASLSQATRDAFVLLAMFALQ